MTAVVTSNRSLGCDLKTNLIEMVKALGAVGLFYRASEVLSRDFPVFLSVFLDLQFENGIILASIGTKLIP